MSSVLSPRIIGSVRSATIPLARSADARSDPDATSLAARSPSEWICFDGPHLTPVLDIVSRHLHLACKAFDASDENSAACELRAVAAELRTGAIKAGRRVGAAAGVDAKFAQVVAWRLASVAARISIVAQTIASRTTGNKDQLAALIDAPTCTDIERRWLITDEDVWYPVCGEPQRHFEAAIRAYECQDLKTMVTEVLKATGYLRLEAGRATENAKRALDAAVAGLGNVAMPIVLASTSGRRSLENRFAVAGLALALAHGARSSHWWVRGNFRAAGYELKAAAGCLEGAASWVANAGGLGASKGAREAKALGERLVWGDGPKRDEALRAFVSFGSVVDTLARKINAS